MRAEKPIIGVTTSNGQYSSHPSIELLQAYTDAVITADGIPVLIPSQTPESSWMQLLDKLDGLLFTGGGDIAPQSDQDPDTLNFKGIDLSRDQLELPMINQVIQKQIPFLGICRGFQVLNVALGGTLYSDLSSQKQQSIKHDYYPNYNRNFLAHRVEIKPDSTIGKITGETKLTVNSLHHQGIKTLADRLIPVGYADDGLVEAVEIPDYPFGIAVQWHPEWLQNDESMKALFSSFIDAAGKNEK